MKFAVNPRGGMYLGRCFLTSDEAVGEVWAEYKNHPSMYCTVQDDDFVGQHRELSRAYDDFWLDEDNRSPEVAAKARPVRNELRSQFS